MALIEANLADIWLVLIGFFLLYYSIADGAGLGIGMLSLLTRKEKLKLTMMHSIGDTWHANQTWLIILGGMLFGAFPLFYSVLLSALYVPIIIMLIGFVFRGVSFEFYENARSKRVWLYSFGFGSLIVALAQGFALGGLLGGLDFADNHFSGSVWGWLTPYSALVAGGVLSGYLMLGSNYLIIRSTGFLQEQSYRLAWLTGILTLMITAAVHVGTALQHQDMLEKLTNSSGFQPLLLGITMLVFVLFFRSLVKRQETAPFFWNGIIIIFSFTSLSIGLYPNMVPGEGTPAMTVQTAAASPQTLKFMLVTMVLLLPIILVYTSYNYWIFRGKTDDGSYEQNG
jgi:cytochrome d ubiquinol oxidase subunit II